MPDPYADHTPPLPIEHSPRALQLNWFMERVAWGVIALLLLAAAVGLFGSGPLSRANVTAKGGRLRVDYERFARRLSPVELRFFADAGLARDGVLIIWIPQSFLSSFEVQIISPTPTVVHLDNGQLNYHFAVDPGEDMVEVRFHLRAINAGRVQGELGIVGGPQVPVSQFVYP